MKRIFTIIFAVFCTLSVQLRAQVVLDSTNFPDQLFRIYIAWLTGVDVGKTIPFTTLATVTTIDVREKNITSLKGIEHFYNLRQLNCYDNRLTSLDVSKNAFLQLLVCSNNQLSSLDVSSNTLLEILECDNNALTSLDVSKNTKLTQLECHVNKLTSIDVSKNTELDIFLCHNNQLTSLDISKNTNLIAFNCSFNQLTSLDVSKNLELCELSCYNNNLTSIDLSKNPNLIDISCYSNQLTSLDLSNNTKVDYLSCHHNRLTSLEVSKCLVLTKFYCHDNLLTSLSLFNNTLLENISFNNNQLITLDLSNCTKINKVSNNQAIQESTRRFSTLMLNDFTGWALWGEFGDASHVRNLKIDGVSKAAEVVSGYYLKVSDDLKKIPQKVEYEYNTDNSVAGWMKVTVNYDVKNYGVYIDGTELTTLNIYNIPALKSGTAYLNLVADDIHWSDAMPTLVLNNAKIEGKEGLLIDYAATRNIDARGSSEIKATGDNGLCMENISTLRIDGGGTVRFTSTDYNGSIIGEIASVTIVNGSTAIFKGKWHGYDDEGGALQIMPNSTMMAFGENRPSAYLPYPHLQNFSEGIALRYPVGAYIGGNNGFQVYYAGTTTEVQNDWVVIGPEGAVPPEDGKNYDLNGDGKVSTADIQVIINEMKKPQASQNMMYDLNADGKISTADIQVIINEMKK